MPASFRARFRYKSDEFLSSGAGKQLFLLFVLSMVVVLVHTGLAFAFSLHNPENTFGGRFWFYFTRILDAGTMGGDEGTAVRVISTVDTILGVIVAGLLISSLSGNFQERLEAIKKGGSPVIEEGHFLILGWSEKIFSVIDMLCDANDPGRKGNLTFVVMGEGDKVEMDDALRESVGRPCKLVVRSGSSVSLADLEKVAFSEAQAIVVLVNDTDTEDPNRADGRVIKTLMALYNHANGKGRMDKMRVAAEVMLAANREIAEIASDGRASVVKTNDIISKIILQTSRISGLSLVYEELLAFEGNEFHMHPAPQCAGQRFGDVLLDFPNGCVVGTAKADGTHQLNPAADHVIAPDEALLILAEDPNITYAPNRAMGLAQVSIPGSGAAEKAVEHMLILGWNEKIFPIMEEFDNYVGPGSSVTIVCQMAVEEQQKLLADKVGKPKNVDVRNIDGEFTSRKLMEQLQPQRYPTVMVLGDKSGGGGSEDADTRAIIALLLLRDFRRRSGLHTQEVCSEILDPKNRELAATTEIKDVVISNQVVSMVLAQVTQVPRIRPVLEDLFQSEGSETYLKAMSNYVELGQPTTFEHLILAAKVRNEVAMGYQLQSDDAAKRYGLVLNPADRRAPIVPKQGDRLIVLAEDDG
ncbi:MAG: hypothetical protein IT370_11460 [Deltaproteobacteria bacterium]|nr:hypothetical protein [Deltaproteobacteria bacterium]